MRLRTISLMPELLIFSASVYLGTASPSAYALIASPSDVIEFHGQFFLHPQHGPATKRHFRHSTSITQRNSLFMLM